AEKWLEKAVAQTDKEVRADAQHTRPELWVRQPTLRLLRAEAEAQLREAATGPAAGAGKSASGRKDRPCPLPMGPRSRCFRRMGRWSPASRTTRRLTWGTQRPARP